MDTPTATHIVAKNFDIQTVASTTLLDTQIKSQPKKNKLPERDYQKFLKVIGDYVFISKYARYNEKEKRRETWDEAVSRVFEMHEKKFRDKLSVEDLEQVKLAFEMVHQKKVVPSMRSMQFGGEAIEKKHARIFNCAVRHIDSTRAFAEIFHLLLCGSGVGLGLSKKYLGRFPNLVSEENKTGIVITFVVEDTIEGWADSMQALLECYFKNTAYSGRKIVFDYSRIRRKGAKLKIGGGKAPGYKPLQNAHKKIKALLDKMIEENKQTRMRSIDAYDIVMHCADAVLSGGVRRSATSVVFEYDDDDMMNAKTGEWYKENPQRGRSNNSVLLIRDKMTFDQVQHAIQRTKEFGEPGFVFGSEDELFNPCLAGDTKIAIADGRGNVPIKQLAEENYVGPIFTLKDGKQIIGHCSRVWKTQENVKLLEIGLSDGSIIRCTPIHKLMLLDGEYKMAKDLLIECDYLMPYNTSAKTIITITELEKQEDVYDLTVDETHNFAIVTLEDSGFFSSNCFEISFKPITEDGTCGVQFCNLSSINGTTVESKEDFFDRVKAAAIIGTLQAAYTEFPYLSPAAKSLTEEEALLGVSVTGWFDKPDILLNKNNQILGAKLAVEINEEWASKIGIKPAARVTTVKPEGTSSLVLHSSSGINPHYAKQYFRRVQANKLDPIYQFFKTFNPGMSEESVHSANKTDDVISFPLTVPEGAITAMDLDATKHLQIIRDVQKYWVMNGINPKANKKNLCHNVSSTVNVRDDEWDDVAKYLFKHRDIFTAVSLLPFNPDAQYAQMPWESVQTQEDEDKFNALVDGFEEVDYKYCREEHDETHLAENLTCAGNNCLI